MTGNEAVGANAAPTPAGVVVADAAGSPLFDPAEPPISAFAGPWRFLSNFADPAVTVFEGATYPTSEAAYNAGKTLDPVVRAWIAAAGSAGEAKRRGNNHNKVALRPDWNSRVRYEVMDVVLHAKFTAHPARAAALLSTGMRELIEGNTWCDQVWGRCTCTKHLGTGQNRLGLALMRLRARLRAEAGVTP